MGGLLLDRFFDPSFAASAELLWPLAVAAAFAGPVLLGLGPLLNAKSATHLTAAMAGVAAVVNVVANAILIPAFGLSGCAWATALAYGSATGATLLLVRPIAEVPASRYLLGVTPALVAALLAPGADAVAAGLALSLAIGLARRRSFATVLRRLSLAFVPGLVAAASPGGRRDG
jgi:O-antigen/teichoic acid export membrane protein